MPVMRNKTRRARTGCLTCRARRVKCDEQTPECRRCISANFACAGYAQPRIVTGILSRQNKEDDELETAERQPRRSEPQQSRRHDVFSYSSSASPSQQPAHNEAGAAALLVRSSSGPQIGQEGRSDNQFVLAAFSSSPRRSQIPCPGAQHVLGYNQVHLRTMPILFGAEYLPFWQGELLQDIWGCDYLYLSLVALGNIHRATLMTVSQDEDDHAHGLDTTITAAQLYTTALESLAKNLDQAKGTPLLLVATLCLMAYFEAFSGNIPGFIGRIQAADYYFTSLLPTYSGPGSNEDVLGKHALAALRDCLRSLGQTCYVTLPLKEIHTATEQHLHSFYQNPTECPETGGSATTPLKALHSLVDIISVHDEIKELIWCPSAPYTRETPVQMINELEKELELWKTDHVSLIPELRSESALEALLIYRWSSYTIPPPPYESTTQYTSLAAAHYNFYKARLRWALLLLGIEEQRNQLIADFYFYEALRHAASHVSFFIVSGLSASSGNKVDAGRSRLGSYVPCEALRVGLLPVLHITGLCSPDPRWLKWIKNMCNNIVREGVLKGHTFATNLESLHVFETQRYVHKHGQYSQHGSPAINVPDSIPSLAFEMERYPRPAERVICQLLPGINGREFTSFFAAPARMATEDAGDNYGTDGQIYEENSDVSHVSNNTGCRRQTGLASYIVIGDARWTCGYGELPCTPVFNVYNSGGDGNSPALPRFSMNWLYNSQPAQEWLSRSQEKGFNMERALEDHINGSRLLLAFAGKNG